MSNKPVRVLWLLNHTTLRRFEIEQFRLLGITEIYCPKSFPYDEGNLSASVDFSLDEALSIPKDELDLLNQQNWYERPSEGAWAVANKYFDLAVIGFFPEQISQCSRYFKGAIVLRVFGLARGYSYGRVLADELGPYFIDKLRALGGRFWFGAGYEHLKEEESRFIRARSCFLPVGLHGGYVGAAWKGRDRRIFFVCPRIETSPYFREVYRDFVRNFGDLGYLVGGAQPLDVSDPNVVGFVPKEEHERNMRELRVMFYHSSEPNHVHYHPFEAVRAGMPLIFMAGGMLDRMGGERLPGRCRSVADAREKLKRILDDDWVFIEEVRESQTVLLDAMSPEICAGPWRASMETILEELRSLQLRGLGRQGQKRRIAVILPIAYGGGTLRGAKLLAEALKLGSEQSGEPVDVVLAHLDDEELYDDSEFWDLAEGVARRTFSWKTLTAAEAGRAMRYAGLEEWRPAASEYVVPDDRIRQFLDCDLWIVVSDRLVKPLLPLRPVVLMVYDYIQRYVPILAHGADQPFLDAARRADRVLVTTEFTRLDAVQYAGVSERKVRRVPMLAPAFEDQNAIPRADTDRPYFLWTTNAAPHKNHERALRALRSYYEVFDGQLDCVVTGVGTRDLAKGDKRHSRPVHSLISESRALQQNVHWFGSLPDVEYRSTLATAQFVWHPARIDNGTFCVVEAARLGVPALSADYPAMREIDAQFSLQLAWMDPSKPSAMARQLKYMEENVAERRSLVPGKEVLEGQSVERLAQSYWRAVRECL